MSIKVLTFGCRLNSYESEVMKQQAERSGARQCHFGQYLRGDQ